MVISIYTRIVMFPLKEELTISCCAGFTHSYGEEKLAVLTDHFGADSHRVDAKLEWITMRGLPKVSSVECLVYLNLKAPSVPSLAKMLSRHGRCENSVLVYTRSRSGHCSRHQAMNV